MHISSRAFADGEEIPQIYTQEGLDVSPPLAFQLDVQGAQTLALVVEDPDAPSGLFTHWILYNLPAETKELVEGAVGAALPPGTLSGANSWGRLGWGGPNPPDGRHRYHFRLFALDTALPDLRAPDREALLRAMEGHVLAEATLTGLYAKKAPQGLDART